MERGRIFETIVGLFVLIVAVFFFNYVYTKSGWKKENGYIVTAYFDNATGLSEGIDVKISGIPVGKILETSINPNTFVAIIKFYVQHNIKLPKDTSATIQTDGLLGSKFLSLMPGGEEENLKEGDVIENTSGALNIEALLSQFLFSKKDSNEQDSSLDTNTDINSNIILDDAEDTLLSRSGNAINTDNTDNNAVENVVLQDNHMNTNTDTSEYSTLQDHKINTKTNIEEDKEFEKQSLNENISDNDLYKDDVINI